MIFNNITPLLAECKRKILLQNNNLILLINGETGSGKSYGSLDIALQISKELGTHFDLKTNLAFTFNQFLDNTENPVNHRRGAVYIFEEVGAMGSGAAATQWQQKANIAMDTFVQTHRSENQILIFTCPFLHNLQKKTRQMIDYRLQTCGINRKEKSCLFKLHRVQVSRDERAKLYFHRLIVRKDGLPQVVNGIKTHLPPKEVIKEYEALKKEYQDKLKKKLREVKELTAVEQRVYDRRKKGMLQKDIAKELNINVSTVCETLARCRKKGYNTQKPLEK